MRRQPASRASKLGSEKVDWGKPSANTAVAHQPARKVCFMLTRGEEFVDKGQQRTKEQQLARSVAAFKRRAGAVDSYAPSGLRHGRLRSAYRQGHRR